MSTGLSENYFVNTLISDYYWCLLIQVNTLYVPYSRFATNMIKVIKLFKIFVYIYSLISSRALFVYIYIYLFIYFSR